MSRPGKIMGRCVLRAAVAVGVLLFLTVYCPLRSSAQTRADTGIVAPVRLPDSTVSLTDSTAVVAPADTAGRAALEQRLGIRISSSGLNARVTATATDSAVLDLTRNEFQLYGTAQVQYDDLTLNAGRVTYNQSSGEVIAEPLVDSSGRKTERPTFTQGSEKFGYDWLRYNFNSRRAIVRNARTQYGEGYVFSEQVKRNPDQSIYGLRSVYTTCSLDTPHFGIRSRRIKVVPGRIAVSGTANLEIERVPTPLYLPFAMFPISQTQRSGFRIPSYTFEQARGLGLTNGGYYFHFNEYADLLISSNIYSQGSWNASAISTYVSRYKFNGGVDIQYGYDKLGESYEAGSSITKSYAIRWRHSTDPKARPGVTFNANVNIQKNNYFQRFSYNPNLILNNQFQSNVTFQRTWQTSPMSLTIAARHAQNSQTRLVTVSAPDINFNRSQIAPFKRRVQIGTPRWYEKITANYNAEVRNETNFYDSNFVISDLAALRWRNGIKHSLPITAAYNVLRFVNLSFGTSYNEYWLSERQQVSYNQTSERRDTVFQRGFFTARDFQASVNASTRIYGLKLFKRGRVAGVRHVITPNVGLTYTPNFAARPFNYARLTQIDSGAPPQYISPFSSSIIGIPGFGQYGDFASNINFGIGNNVQMKLRSRRRPGDTAQAATRNVSLIDGLDIGGAYNLAADSFNLSAIGVRFRTNIANVLQVSASTSLDPYGIDYATGRRQRRLAAERGAGIGRISGGDVSVSASFRSKQNAGGGTERTAARTDEFTRLVVPGGYNDYVDFNIPWSFAFSYSLGLANNYSRTRRVDTLEASQFIQLNGDVNLTPRWKLTFTSGYNITLKQLTLTSIDIYRDLHCWEMRLGTIPFGPRKSYNFTLNVKASVLQDLRLLRRRDFRDAVF